MEMALVIGFAIGFAVCSTLLWVGFLLAGIVRIPDGHVMGLTRGGQGDGSPMTFVRSGTSLVMPFFQRGALYPVTISPGARREVTITRNGVALMVCGFEVEILPEQDDEGLARYVVAFGGRKAGEIEDLVGRVVEGGARHVLEAFSLEAVSDHPEKVVEHLQEHVGDDLKKLGLRIEARRLTVRPAPRKAGSREASEFSLDGFRAV